MANENTTTVKAWNIRYKTMVQEYRLKDMNDTAYEQFVIDELLDVCDGNATTALEVFNHEDNAGGWACGNVKGKLEAMAQTSPSNP